VSSEFCVHRTSSRQHASMGVAGGIVASFTYRKETLSTADFHALTRSLREELDVPVRLLSLDMCVCDMRVHACCFILCHGLKKAQARTNG